MPVRLLNTVLFPTFGFPARTVTVFSLSVIVFPFFGCYGYLFGVGAADGYYLTAYGLTLAILGVGSTHWVKNGWNRLPERARDVLGPVLMLAGLVVCTAYLVDGSYNPFLYFRF